MCEKECWRCVRERAISNKYVMLLRKSVCVEQQYLLIKDCSRPSLMRKRMFERACVYKCVCVCASVCVWVDVGASMCVCVCVYASVYASEPARNPKIRQKSNIEKNLIHVRIPY